MLLTAISTIDDLNYLEMTSAISTYYIGNVPYIFSACWKVLQPLLQERTKLKVQVLQGCGRDEQLMIMDYFFPSSSRFRKQSSQKVQHKVQECVNIEHHYTICLSRNPRISYVLTFEIIPLTSVHTWPEFQYPFLLLSSHMYVPNGDAFISAQETADGFFHDILLESPLDGERSGEVVDVSDGCNSVDEQRNKAVDDQNNKSVDDHKEQKENSVDDPNDPLAKKRKRQLRNKDAALKSRERKKMYVKDLEMKSRYYEGECKRLGSLLQYFMAENQALRFSLHSSKACNASMTKQESSVLLLESLLLGSLLWLVGIVCQLVLPSLQLHQQSLGAGQGLLTCDNLSG